MASRSGTQLGKKIFITFEGTEGSGKSTLIQIVAEHLRRDWGREVIVTREPGGTELSEKIRGFILHEKMDPHTELFLYEAARAEHVAKKILPALEKGIVVLCDRFTDSSIAYQGEARGLSIPEIRILNRIATQRLNPTLTVLLDLPPQHGLSRVREFNRFEAEGLEFHERVRRGYLKLAKQEPKRWLKIDVTGKTPDELAALVFKRLKKSKK